MSEIPPLVLVLLMVMCAKASFSLVEASSILPLICCWPKLMPAKKTKILVKKSVLDIL